MNAGSGHALRSGFPADPRVGVTSCPGLLPGNWGGQEVR